MPTDPEWPRLAGPADLALIERVPLAERDVPATTYDIVLRARARWPDRAAVTLLPSGARWREPTTWTADDLADRVTRIANVLTTLGVGRTDAVSILSPNTGLLLATTLAAQAVGMVAPVNPTLAPEHVSALIEAAGGKVLVAAGPELDAALWQRALALAPAAGIRTLLALRPDGADAPPPMLETAPGLRTAWLEDLMGEVAGDRLVGADAPAGTDIAGCFHTGGTTGVPKLAVHTHSGEAVMAWMIATFLPLPVPSTILAGLPLFHVNALLVTGLAPLLRGHRSLWTGPLGYRDPALLQDFWAVVETYQVAAMSAVPTVYGVLCDRPVDADISCLQLPIVGAAPLPRAVRERFAAHTGVELCEGYGLTEATCASAVTPPGWQRPGSVGMRLPYQRIKAVAVGDDGSWTDLGHDETGVLAIHRPTVFPGFLVRDADGTARIEDKGVLRDGWLDTGDLGHVDADGFVHLTGRAKDLIIRGGHNIDPVIIEDAMLSHPDVTAAAAVGRPDAHAGEVPVVYVVVAGEVTTEALEAWADEHVTEPAAVPKAVHIIDAIPVTAVGKPFKPALREDAARRVGVGTPHG